MSEQPREGSGSGERDAADDVLGKAVDLVPEGKPRTFLVQAGWVGLVLSYLIGNIPLTALITAVAKGQGTLNTGALETYWIVFVIVTPWVAAFAAIGFLIGMDYKLHPYGLAFGGAILVALAGWVSLELGGAVPLDVAQGPSHGSPVGAAEYVVKGLGSYLELYGPLPPLAGLLEGSFLGYWSSVLAKS